MKRGREGRRGKRGKKEGRRREGGSDREQKIMTSYLYILSCRTCGCMPPGTCESC